MQRQSLAVIIGDVGDVDALLQKLPSRNTQTPTANVDICTTGKAVSPPLFETDVIHCCGTYSCCSN